MKNFHLALRRRFDTSVRLSISIACALDKTGSAHLAIPDFVIVGFAGKSRSINI